MAVFKARARTLEMLGKQQIAGIPTAISELFKNAHDAYADNVEVDYYRSDGLFVLRDDGMGMTKQEFEDRWLTLGTESKLNSSKGLSLPPTDHNKEPRPILGEKGVGRLAIASIGNQVLVLTRAKRDGVLGDLIASFVHWDLFGLPGIDLDEIVIPLHVFQGGTLPTKEDVKDMISEVTSNVRALAQCGKVSSEDENRLIDQLDSFILDPIEIDGFLNEPSLSGNGHGTHFFILPASDLLEVNIDDDKDGTVPPLIKMLIGFTNTMTPSAPKPRIRASFRDHKTEEYCTDLIEEREFFIPEEFQIADHHIKGEFDDYGNFLGNVSVYGKKFSNYVIPWKESKGKKTLCGPFKINLAYVQGLLSQTKIPPEDYALLSKKLDRLGGLYVYKDGIRILPYGDADYDFLNIEKRRTKSASYYFFSYRRMFGVFEISQKDNFNLKEKAGREGFIENKAFRQFRDICENLFLQLASDFFRESSSAPNAEVWAGLKNELETLYKAKLKRERQVSVKKKKLQDDLNLFFKRVKEGKPQEEINEILEYIKRSFSYASKIKDVDTAVRTFLDTESDAKRKLQGLREKYRISKPRGIGMGKNLQSEWEAYIQEAESLEKKVFEPSSAQIKKLFDDALSEFDFAAYRRQRQEKALADIIDEAKKVSRSKSTETRKSVDDFSNRVVELTRNIMNETEKEINEVLTEFAKLDVSKMEDGELALKMASLESSVSNTAERSKEILEIIRSQIENITWEKDENGELITSVDMTESMEEELLMLRDKTDLDFELSQLGSAIAIIHHEFNSTIRSTRKNIQSLRTWADVNEDLQPLYRNIRMNFEHLDGYLKLFTPLDRRLNRKKIDIQGKEIKKYIEDIFMERFHRHHISLEDTNKFKRKVIFGYPSTFYPVFINLIDNAIFWLKDQPTPRRIVFDADENGIFISNNGPKILIQDREKIFEFGYSKKPLGRGLGLYICREVLSKNGYLIYVSEPLEGMNVTFRIEENQSDDKKLEG